MRSLQCSCLWQHLLVDIRGGELAVTIQCSVWSYASNVKAHYVETVKRQGLGKGQWRRWNSSLLLIDEIQLLQLLPVLYNTRASKRRQTFHTSLSSVSSDTMYGLIGNRLLLVVRLYIYSSLIFHRTSFFIHFYHLNMLMLSGYIKHHLRV